MRKPEVSFGRFRLDLGQRELTRDGAPVPLGNRALEILCALATANGELVSKDQLMAQVWSGVIVEENNIQVHVSALRKALQDGKNGDTHLLTVPGRGYRLVGVNTADAVVGGIASTPETSSGKSSIAVLPFQNMSFEPEQEYFADGMVEEIITGLSRIKWLSVVSRNSTFTSKTSPSSSGKWPRSSALVMCLKAACAKPATACVSARSSSTERAALNSGPSSTIVC